MKKRPARKSSRAKTGSSAALTEALESCRHITTLAGLLEQCGQVRLAKPLEPRLVADTGGMIAAESRAVEDFLQHLELHSRV